MQKRTLWIASLLLALLFLLTSWMWSWLFNVVISLPAGLTSLTLLLIYRSKHGMDRGAILVARLLAAGLITALISFLLFQ